MLDWSTGVYNPRVDLSNKTTLVEAALVEESRPPESVFDFEKDITAVSRSKPQQDARLALEGMAKALFKK